MGQLNYREREADPRCVMAVTLFETMPDVHKLGYGHARENLLYALKMSVLTPEESGYAADRHAVLLESIVNQWIRGQYRAAWLGELQRIRRSVLEKYPQSPEPVP